MTFDNRTTELIAIGASVAANCQSCVEYHLAKAAEYGIEQTECAQAAEIGRMVRKGAAAASSATGDRAAADTSFATRCAPFASMAAEWAGAFPFCGCHSEAKP